MKLFESICLPLHESNLQISLVMTLSSIEQIIAAAISRFIGLQVVNKNEMNQIYGLIIKMI